jgi:LPXTG-motif cell wall-anchored protein
MQMKRTTLKLGAFLTSLFALFVLFPAAAYAAPTTIEINPANFPDANFRSWVDTNYGNSGYLDDSALTETFIDVSLQSITTLQGIEYFPLLEELRCYDNNLTALNVSNNSHLATLICPGNQIDTIDVSSNLLLEHLDISENRITSLDVNNLQSLWALTCYDNLITSLNVKNNPLLQELWCFDNQLTSLDVSGNPLLYGLECDGNMLLDIVGLSTPLSYRFSATNQAVTILVVPDPANPGSWVSTRPYPLYTGHTIAALAPGATYNPSTTFSTTTLDAPLSFITSTAAGNVTGTITFKLAPQYTVTYLDWDGAVLDTRQVYEGLAPVAPSDPSRSGYVFVGWGQPVTDPASGIVTITALYDPIATVQTPSTVLPATGDTNTPLLALGVSSLIAAALALLARRRRTA